MPDSRGSQQVHRSEAKAEPAPSKEAELQKREHEFVAIYGTVFGTLEPDQRKKVRAAIEKELSTIKS